MTSPTQTRRSPMVAMLETMPPASKRPATIAVPGEEDIPVTLVRGRARRPVGAIIAGVHGDEVEGVVALGELARDLDPSSLHGSLVVVHAANPAAVRAGTREHPVDSGDLNRAFPGGDGGATPRLARTVAGNLLDGLDALLTLHSWSRTGMAVPYVEYPAGSSEIHKRSRGLARVLGTRFVEAYDWPSGLLPAEGIRRGIASAEIEVGGLGAETPSGRGAVRRAVQRFLWFTGITAGAPEEAVKEPIEIRRTTLISSADGLASQRVGLGEWVEAGEPCVEVRSPDGGVLASLQAPRGGYVGIHLRFGWVEPGTAVAVLFHPERSSRG
jgi:N-alpha-acetyl-L-2,4-diaminobutyrate deacetylase